MKINRKIMLCVMVLSISAIAMSINAKHIENKGNDQALVTSVYNSYPEEYKNPYWSLDNSDIIIEGTVMEQSKSVKAKDRTSSANNVVYTDVSVKISEILKNNINSNIKIGDIITVRILGGTVDNLTYETDSNELLTKNKNMLLCLIDGNKDITLPSSNTQIFSVTGEVHGAFELNGDGTVTCTKTKEKFQVDDLKKHIKNN